MLMVHRSIVALSACAGLASVASAQTAWLNPVSGSWGTPANWTAGVPSSIVDATIGLAGAFEVTIASSASAKTLAITNPLAKLRIDSGFTYLPYGDITNHGTITVNTTAGAADARISMANPAVTLGGSGTLVLNAGTSLGDAHIIHFAATDVLTHAAGHTITGRGQILVNTVNNGLIVAAGAGNTIELLTNPKTNNNLILAQGGGMIDVTNVTVTQVGGGILRALGAGSVVEASGGVVGGTVAGLSGGVFRTGGTLALDGVTCNGTGQFQSGHDVNLSTSLTNNGVITLNPTGGAADARILVLTPALALNGSGEIVLGAVASPGDAQITVGVVSQDLIQDAAHTISGSGQILATFVNNGTVTADVAGRVLELGFTSKTNNNLMLAENGGILDLDAFITQGASGVIRATGAGSVALVSPVTGGVVESVGGGLVRLEGPSTLDSITLNGVSEIPTGNTIDVANSLIHSGVMTINPTAAAADARLRIETPTANLSGPGEIVLNAGASAGDAHITFTAGGNTLFHDVGHTISGTGQIFVNTVNSGTITADAGGKVLQLLNQPKTNHHLMLAENGATLDIEGITVTQGAGGIIRATGAGSVIEASGSIAGGVVESVGAGSLIRTGGTLGLEGLTINGAMEVLTGHVVNASNAFVNNATIVVNPSAGAADARIIVATPVFNITGTGEVVLNAVGSMGDAHVTFGAATNLLVNGPDHALAGRGQVFAAMLNQGTISPGHAITGDLTQTIELAGTAADVTCDASSFIQIDLEDSAAGQYDTITGGTSIDFVCHGTLALNHVGGFVGMLPGEFIDIIDVGTVTGQFATIQRPTLEGQNRYEVQYLPDRVRLIVVCYADCDADTLFSIDDFICFQTLFALGDSYADCDLDSFLSIDDFICYQTYFAIGC